MNQPKITYNTKLKTKDNLNGRIFSKNATAQKKATAQQKKATLQQKTPIQSHNYFLKMIPLSSSS
jgi:hypothetical protein